MNIYCISDTFPDPASRTIIEFVLNRIGFFYEWISDTSSIPGKSIIISYTNELTPADSHGIPITIPRQFILNNMRSDLIFWKQHNTGNHTIPILKESESFARTKNGYCLYEYDLIANIYAHLARVEESNFTHPDEIDENIEEFILYKYEHFLVPVVDIMVEEFQMFLQKVISKEQIPLLRKATFPQGQQFGIALTHDVDIIRAYHPLKKLIFKVLIVLGFKKGKQIEDLDAEDRSVWGFDGLLKQYKSKGWKATFFFMAKYREDLHFRYRISTAKFKDLFRQLKKENHEIALHPSRYSFDFPMKYKIEKRRLERISGSTVSGLRHHYLRCLFPQIWNVVKNIGMHYDASMIYRKNSGFRAGTTSFYPAFINHEDGIPEIIECPTHFFENTLPEKGEDIQTALKQIKKIMDWVKRFQGIFVMLWHTNNLYAHRPYPDLWQNIVKLIESERAYIATIKEHIEWIRLRNGTSIQADGSQDFDHHFTLDFPPGLLSLTLILPEENLTIATAEKDIFLKQKKDLLYLTNLKDKKRLSFRMSHGT